MSRFVSGGTNEAPIERDDEWLKAQQELEARRLQKLDEGRQQDGKSLYEVLEANKAAKQDAFEEKIKLKNQFRSLDDDEVEFLDSVLESTRAKEAEVRRETIEQLSAFRRQQEEAERAVAADGDDTTTAGLEAWAPKGRKRRKSQGKDSLIGVKLRKTSSTGDSTEPAKPTMSRPEQLSKDGSSVKSTVKPQSPVTSPSSATASAGAVAATTKPQPAGLGLGDYSSDAED